MPIVPGLVIDTVVPAKSSTVSLFVARLADELFVRGVEGGEVERVGVLDVRHEQRARAVVLLQVDREAEVDVLVAHDRGLAVDDAERRVHVRHRLQRAQHRVADEVRERHLAAAGAGEMVVEDLAVDLEQLRRDRSHRRGGGDLEARLHVLDDARGGAAQRLRLLAVEHDRRGGVRGRGGSAGAARPAVRRGAARARCGGAATGGWVRGHVALEELAPPGGQGLRVVLVQAVHLVDQARVRAELLDARRCLAAAGLVCHLYLFGFTGVGFTLSVARARRGGTRGRATGGR